MCFDRECCTNYQPLKNNKFLFLGDNTTHEIHGQAVVIIRLLNNIENKIPKVLHVPKLKEKKISPKHFDKVGGEMHIKQG